MILTERTNFPKFDEAHLFLSFSIRNGRSPARITSLFLKPSQTVISSVKNEKKMGVISLSTKSIQISFFLVSTNKTPC